MSSRKGKIWPLPTDFVSPRVQASCNEGSTTTGSELMLTAITDEHANLFDRAPHHKHSSVRAIVHLEDDASWYHLYLNARLELLLYS